MKILTANVESFVKTSRTNLTAAVVAGSSVVLPVPTSSGFLVNDYIVVGLEGSDNAELCQVSAIPDITHITVTTLLLAHNTDDPIVKYLYNQRKFYGSTVTGGPYTQLTAYGSPAAIGVDDPQGSIIEYTGTEGYLYFKATYYNSSTAVESDIADANEVYADESARYCSLYDIRKQAGLTDNPYITDDRVESKRKQAENEVNSYIYARYILPLINDLSVAEVPFLVGNCAKLLAAGYLDYEEYGSAGQGVKWLGEARAILKAIQLGTQRLIGTDGVEFQLKTNVAGPQGYPKQVDNFGHDGPERAFTMHDQF